MDAVGTGRSRRLLSLRDTARAMSEENVELPHRATDAFNRRDFVACLALMDDDVEVAARIAVIEGGLHGHDGVRRWWENWLDTWPDYNIEVIEVRDSRAAERLGRRGLARASIVS